MAGFQARHYAGQQDMDAAIDLLLTARTLDPSGAYPTIPRLRTLLTCRLWQPELDARLWADAAGHLAGVAALVPPAPASSFVPLILVAHPTHAGDELRAAMLGWAGARAGAGGPAATLYVQADDQDHALQRLLVERSFTREPVQVCYLARARAGPLAAPAFPAGLTLRQVPASDTLDRYLDRDAPLFARWGVAERRRLMASPDYDPALDLVVEAADGTLAAYCECATSRTAWARGGRREGWIDMVATHPDLRRRGIGRALLLAALRRLRAAGADTARLFTESTNESALRLYAALGFQRERTAWQYAHAISGGPGAA